MPVGIDEDGRERLVFIDGDVPVPPYPDWSQSDPALASIARLLRGLHDAARGFDPQGLTWDDTLADPAGGTLVCHNDVCPGTSSSVTASPSRCSTSSSLPLAAPSTTSPTSPASAYRSRTTSTRPGSAGDPPTGRHGYDSSPTPTDWTGVGRAELLTAMNDAIDRVEAAVRRSVDAGDPNSIAMWNRTGGSERYDRRRRWWTDHHDQFAAALL